MNEITKHKDVTDLAGLEEQFKPLIDNFQKKLSEPPDPKIVKTMQGFKYIPVEIIEAKLDKYYSGLWKTENLKYSIEINSVAVSLDLHVFHPIAKSWIIRTGIASVPVQLDRETKVIKQTALQKNLPAAKAIAFKNAAQSLGRSFGRNLNRGFDVPFREDTFNFKDIKV